MVSVRFSARLDLLANYDEMPPTTEETRGNANSLQFGMDMHSLPVHPAVDR